MKLIRLLLVSLLLVTGICAASHPIRAGDAPAQHAHAVALADPAPAFTAERTVAPVAAACTDLTLNTVSPAELPGSIEVRSLAATTVSRPPLCSGGKRTVSRIGDNAFFDRKRPSPLIVLRN